MIDRANIHALKKTLRLSMKQKRGVLQAQTIEAADKLKNLICPLLFKAKMVAGYVPIGTEISPFSVYEWLDRNDINTCLPCVLLGDNHVTFRQWNMGDALQKNPFGFYEPLQTSLVCVPDIMLIPLLAFDATCHRLGYGQGHYDRTLHALKEGGLVTIGLAYDGQKVDQVPTEAHDVVLDYIVTEKRVYTKGL